MTRGERSNQSDFRLAKILARGGESIINSRFFFPVGVPFDDDETLVIMMIIIIIIIIIGVTRSLCVKTRTRVGELARLGPTRLERLLFAVAHRVISNRSFLETILFLFLLFPLLGNQKKQDFVFAISRVIMTRFLGNRC